MFATMHLELGSITKLIDLHIIISFFSKQKLDSAIVTGDTNEQ